MISLIIVGAGAGLGGYFLNAVLHPGLPTITLSGAGASLPYPLISTWTVNYHNLHSNIQINYQSIGSGAGITDFNQTVVDFAGTDSPPSASSLPTLHSTTLSIPETIGAVTLAYNVAGLSTGLQLNETAIARIFNGTKSLGITMWNDPMIQQLNPGVTLPAQSIVTVHRGDSSGTTFIFEGYLVQAGQSVWNVTQSKNWPSKGVVAGLSGNQNTGVANYVKNTPNSIGYIEVAYAIQNNLNVAYVQNKDRTSFVKPTLANITSAVSNANTANLPTGLQTWSTVSMILEPGASSYPIVGLTYILVYQKLETLPLMTVDKAKALVDFLWYIVHDGQSASGGLDYATLPQSIVTIDETSIQSITYNGQTLPT